ncbi:hypothetical protein NXT3_PB00314 (plasmid) [Sinorhizobium fredii]|uniref:Uncharacterized protein n=1 Tax=Rhizobium fredii TaxID=380 RepID=A0A2L0HBU7_RHIFR|nr:hypothetical protein NXT3_PB00314 [Sinorhizobium fredii]
MRQNGANAEIVASKMPSFEMVRHGVAAFSGELIVQYNATSTELLDKDREGSSQWTLP